MICVLTVYLRCMIDLDAVRALRAVRDHGTVVAAAEATGYTTSAVSQQVKRLERAVGLPLLERVGRGVILTEHGRRLCDSGGEVLRAVEQVEAGLQAAADRVVGELSVAAFSTALRGLVAPVVRDVLQTWPDLRLRLSESEPWQTVELVAAGRVDLGITHSWGTVPLSIPEHVDVRPLREDRADLVVPAGHPLATAHEVRAADLVDESWVATPEGTICREWLVHMHALHRARPRVVHESAEFDAQLALVRAGLGVALVPRMGRSELTADLVAVPVVDPVPTREVLALSRVSMRESPAVRVLLDALTC